MCYNPLRFEGIMKSKAKEIIEELKSSILNGERDASR
jgi:hypothetical protein